MQKRPVGRPQKRGDTIEPWQFGRAAIVQAAYDEAREKGEKHSVAVRAAVDAVRRHNPKVRISETEVKRVLSRFRPKGSGIILHFERSRLTEEDIERFRSVFEQAAQFAEKMGMTLPQLPVYDETHRREKFLIRFSERPDYPRHNRKAPNE